METSRRDARRGFVRACAAAMGGQAGAGVVALVNATMWARALGPAGQGRLHVAVGWAYIALVLCNAGIAPATAYHVGRGGFAPDLAARQSVLWALLLGVPAGLLLAGLAPHFGATLAPGVPLTQLRLAAALLPALLAQSFLLSVLQGCRAFGAVGRATVVGPMVTLVVGALARLAGGAATAALIAHGLGVACGAVAAWRAVPVGAGATPWRPHGAYLRATGGFGARAYLGNAALFSAQRLDVVLLNAWCGAAAAGLYATASSVGERMALAATVVGQVLVPHAARSRATSLTLTPWTARRVLYGALATVPAVAAVAPWLLPTLFGDAFAGAVAPLRMLLPGVVAVSVGRVLGAAIAAHGAPGALAGVSVACAALHLGAALAWVRPYGAVGAAAACSLSYLFELLLRLALYRRQARA